MKLRSLSVNQFKHFTVPTRLGEFGDGLNLVVGPNELGKSTLLDALRSVLFERHRSVALPIKTLQNDRSGAAPVVELVFEVEGATYTLTKRFIKSAYAQLQCPDGTLLEADAAEAELRNLLGFAEASSHGATPETLGMWGVLWVQQGKSFGRPDLPDSARASLSTALESEVGAVLGGRRGGELPRVIEQRRGELVTTARHQPRGEYKDARDQIGELERRLSEQQQQQREMSDTLKQLADAEAGLKRLDDGNQDQVVQEELNQARDQLGEVTRRELQLEAAHSELQNRLGQLEQAQRAQNERTSLRDQLADRQKQLHLDRGRLQELQQRERESSAPLEELRQTVDNVEAAVEAAEQTEVSWRYTLDLITHSAELNDLVRLQNDVADAQQRLGAAQRQAEQIQVTDESLERIRLAANVADQATAQISVAATRISFDILSDRLGGIEAAGAPLTDPPTTIEAVQPVTIVIPERGRILIEPAVADRDQLLQAEQAAQRELQAALSAVAAESLVEAQSLHDQRRELEAAAVAAQRELERLAPEGAASTLKERIDALREWQASITPQSAAAELPERDVAEAELRSALAELKNARDEERSTRAAVAERSEAVAKFSAEVREAQTTLNYRTETFDLLQERLRSDAERMSDDSLPQAVELTQRALNEQRLVADKLKADWSTSSRPQLETRIEQLQNAIAERATRRTDYKTEIARLRERIEIHDSAGIDEAIEHTQRQLEQLTIRRNHLEHEIEVLELLGDTLGAAASEAKDRYLGPVLNRIHPYLRMLFPNADMSMDEDLNITGMSRGAGYEERFDHLSMGTQEQIAVLVRLAFAEMLVDQGAPATVILDDALVFSDDQRMRLMFDVLSQAAQRVQIVVFTCREQLFEGLSANRLQLVPVDPESLRSA